MIGTNPSFLSKPSNTSLLWVGNHLTLSRDRRRSVDWIRMVVDFSRSFESTI